MVEEYVSVNKNKLQKCYQVQIKDGKMESVFLGEYHEIPVPVVKALQYKNKKLLVITYILTQEEINDKLFKILGLVILDKDSNESSRSVDLIYNDAISKLQLILVDHKNKESKPEVLKTLEEFPKNEDMISALMDCLLDTRVLNLLN